MFDPAQAKEEAPASFQARFVTTAGSFVIEVHREWAPLGADRFYNLVRMGFYEGMGIYRVVKGFVVQWGIHGDPEVSARWRSERIGIDPVVQSNTRGTISYAMSGSPDTRTTQVFINFRDNQSLDKLGFAPFGRVVEGFDVVEKLHSAYGDAPSKQQARIRAEGNEFLREAFPDLDYVERASIDPHSASS